MNSLSKMLPLTIVLLVVFSMGWGCSEVNKKQIVVNEVGYNADNSKVAFVTNTVSENFQLIDLQTKEIVYEGKVQPNYLVDPSSGDVVHEIKFSEFEKTGSYRIKLKDKEIQSAAFAIGDNIYRKPAIKILESFYLQRCGTVVDNGSKWSHPACHLDDANFYSNPQKTKDVTGGWHDAGDFNKFSITTTLSIGFLLYQYEHNPTSYYDGQLRIPESDNEVPDILDEIRWGLEWLLAMQREDGGVYFKVSTKRWTGEHLPHKEQEERYIFRVNSNATANFAAVAALGSRIFKVYDPAFSSKLQKAAAHAWEFLSDKPVTVPLGGFNNPRDVRGGEYNDHNDQDERLWASVELYLLTRSKKYHDYFLSNFNESDGPGNPPISWKDVENLAYYAYLEIPEEEADREVRKNILNHLSEFANRLSDNVKENRYNYVLRPDQYYWGSNSIAMGYAFDLIQAYRFLGKDQYLKQARDQLHYMLGRNPMQKSYVTNIGKHPVRNPYHQFSMLAHTDNPIPGLLVGGPNNHSHLNGSLSEHPAKNYEDYNKNYMVNEPAINYTAALSYVVGYFMKSPENKSDYKGS